MHASSSTSEYIFYHTLSDHAQVVTWQFDIPYSSKSLA